MFKCPINLKCTECGETKKTFFAQETCSNLFLLELEWMEQDMQELTMQSVPRCEPFLSKRMEKKPKKPCCNVFNLKELIK